MSLWADVRCCAMCAALDSETGDICRLRESGSRVVA
jgi:hypothetical protein